MMFCTKNNDFNELLKTMIPLVLSQLSLMGMNVMDATMSGHAGPVDLAGVSMGASLFMPVTASFTGILAASTPMIAQLLGRRRKQDIPHVVRTGMALGMLLTALFAFLTIRFEDTSILDFIKYAVKYFFVEQQEYRWKI